jgi:GTP-binding protein HflX
LDLPGGETVLVTDTVGFVRKLPHQVVEAFRSTLEEVGQSDLILHVVDGSAPDFEGQVDAVRTVLAEIGADGLPELLVVNKADAILADERGAGGTIGHPDPAGDLAEGRDHGDGRGGAGEEARRLMAAHEGSVMVSARTGEGLSELLVAMGDRLRVGDRVVELDIPWARGDVLAAVHREGEIVGEEAGEESTRIQVVLDDVGKSRFAAFLAS